MDKTYHDIPGTYVFDGTQNRAGYHLNMFCKSLDVEANRDAFRNDPDVYLDRYPMTTEQRKAIEDRDWLGMLQLGGNIYYTFKIAIFDQVSMQAVGGMMSNMTEEEFRQMMVNGGRSVEGNRSKSEGN